MAEVQPVPNKKKLGRGRPRASDWAALEAIVFVLRTGIPWEMLPTKQFVSVRSVACRQGLRIGRCRARQGCSEGVAHARLRMPSMP
jgi:transposase